MAPRQATEYIILADWVVTSSRKSGRNNMDLHAKRELRVSSSEIALIAAFVTVPQLGYNRPRTGKHVAGSFTLPSLAVRNLVSGV